MQRTREELRDELLSMLSASRELTVADDDALADAMLDRLEARQLAARSEQWPRMHLSPSMYACSSALLILVAIPIVKVIQTYSERDGYLPPLDAGALPAIYWLSLIALVAALLVLAVLNWTDRQV